MATECLWRGEESSALIRSKLSQTRTSISDDTAENFKRSTSRTRPSLRMRSTAPSKFRPILLPSDVRSLRYQLVKADLDGAGKDFSSPKYSAVERSFLHPHLVSLCDCFVSNPLKRSRTRVCLRSSGSCPLSDFRIR